MGLSIGQATRDFARSPAANLGDLARQAVATASRESRAGFFEGDTNTRANRDAALDLRVVNGPAAALRTIDRGVQNARQVVPSVEDILELARERFTESDEARRAREAELRAAAGERTADEEPAKPERVSPEASPRVALFEQAAPASPGSQAEASEPANLQPARPTLNVLA